MNFLSYMKTKMIEAVALMIVVFIITFSVGLLCLWAKTATAQEPALENETGFNAPVAAAPEAKNYTVDFPALRPGDTVTVRFLVTEEASPDAVEMTFAMPTTDTLVAIYAEQFQQAQAGLDQVLKALDADPESVVDTAIYQQNVVGEKAALKRVAETIRPIIIGRGVNGVIRAKRASK